MKNRNERRKRGGWGVYTCIYMCLYIRVCIFTYIYMCVSIYVYICIYLHIHVYIYTYVQSAHDVLHLLQIPSAVTKMRMYVNT